MSEQPQGFWWTGNLMLGRFVNGVMEGYADPIDSMKLEITQDGQEEVIQSNQVEDAGEARDVIYRRKPTKIVFGASAFGLRLLAQNMLGSLNTFSQSAAPSGSTTVTLVKGLFVKLGKLNVSNVAIGALVNGTDFEVLPKEGLVRALTDAAAGSKTVTFDAGAVTGKKIIGGVDTSLELTALMRVENSSDGRSGLLEVHKFKVTPAKAMAFLSSKPIEPEFGGIIIKQSNVSLYDFYPELAYA